MATDEPHGRAPGGWRVSVDCGADVVPLIFGGTFVILSARSGELLRPLAYAALAAAVWVACCLHIRKDGEA